MSAGKKKKKKKGAGNVIITSIYQLCYFSSIFQAIHFLSLPVRELAVFIFRCIIHSWAPEKILSIREEPRLPLLFSG